MDAYVLIDYDNLEQRFRAPNTLSIFGADIARLVEASTPSVQDIFMRLYGGWYTFAGGLSNAGTRLIQEIASTYPLPYKQSNNRRHYVHCEIASSLIDFKGDLFIATVRERHGMRSKLRQKYPPGCVAPGNCSIPIVIQWSSGACPTMNCNVNANGAFLYREQKLVDTLLCCDLIAVGGRQPRVPVFVVSDDDDLVPAIVLALKNGSDIRHVRKNANSTLYDPILARNNIQVLHL
jgi:hypothetical protein